MTKFTIDISDKPSLLGITKAREAYNTALAPITDAKGIVNPNPAIIVTDEAYMQMVMASAAASYAVQFETDPAKLDEKISSLTARKATIEAVTKKG